MAKEKSIVIIAVVALFLVAGISSLFYFTSTGKQSAINTPQKELGGQTLTGAEQYCAQNPNIDLNINILDKLATSVSYVNGTVYLVDLDTNTITPNSITTADGSFQALSDVLNCQTTKGYIVYLKTTAGTMNAAEAPITITREQILKGSVKVTLLATQYSRSTVSVYDLQNKQTMATAASTTAAASLPVTFNRTGATSNISVGTNGYLKVELTLSTENASRADGKDAMLCVKYADDTSPNDWDGSTVALTQDGKALASAARNANDAIALSAYQQCYMMANPVGKVGVGDDAKVQAQTLVDFYIHSTASVAPYFDPILKIVQLGDYQSTVSRSQMLTGVGFQDNAARTALGTATTETVTFAVG